MDSKELTLEELMKLVSTNKATAIQKLKFAELLTKSAEQEATKEKESKVKDIDDYITKQGLSIDEYLKLKKPAPSTEIIFSWTDESGTVHKKINGTKGKWSSKESVKKNLTLEKALTFAIGEKGKAFVKTLYK